jgi:hypothetical protein
VGDVHCSSFSIGGLDIPVLVEQAVKALTKAGLNDQSITALRRQRLETDTSTSSCSEDSTSGFVASEDVGSGDDVSGALANVDDVCTDYDDGPDIETIWYTSTALALQISISRCVLLVLRAGAKSTARRAQFVSTIPTSHQLISREQTIASACWLNPRQMKSLH